MNDPIPRRHPPLVKISRNLTRRGWVLETELWVPHRKEDVFALFADAFQLEALTPPWLHFHVITPAPIRIETGTEIDYRLRLHGLPIRWRSVISVWEPSHRFIDEQVRGPYRWWRHEHSFESHNDGTICRDRVEYGLPFDWLVNRIVARDLKQIFEERAKQFPRLLEESLKTASASS
jgi:ligand-binding SRPBCC domain-containing protein